MYVLNNSDDQYEHGVMIAFEAWTNVLHYV